VTRTVPRWLIDAEWCQPSRSRRRALWGGASKIAVHWRFVRTICRAVIRLLFGLLVIILPVSASRTQRAAGVDRTEESVPVASQGSANLPPLAWQVNAWGEPRPQYVSRATFLTRTFAVSDRGGGDAQLVIGQTFRSGTTYTVNVQVEVDRPITVTLSLRKDGPPWQSFAQRTTHLRRGTQALRVSGAAPPDAEGRGSIRIKTWSAVPINIGKASIGFNDDAKYERSRWRSTPDLFSGMVINKITKPIHWPPFKVRILRLWDTGTTWLDLEPRAGEWHFDRLDFFVAEARTHGAEVMLTLGQTPSWAAAKSRSSCVYGQGCSPPNPDHWRRYVRKLVTRYGKSIRYWELWNEPDSTQFWSGTPERLAGLAVIARSELKSVRPDSILIGPSVTGNGGIDFLDRFLYTGVGRSIDRASFHAYYSSDEQLVSEIADVRQTLRHHSLASTDIWNTEGAASDPAKPKCSSGEENQPYAPFVDVKALFIMRSLGVSHFSYYNWERRDTQCGMLSLPPNYVRMTEKGNMYGRALAYQADRAFGELKFSNGATILETAKGGRINELLWTSKEGVALEIALPQGSRAYDWASGSPLPSRNGRVLLTGRPTVIQRYP
jgi:hypothetical protein